MRNMKAIFRILITGFVFTGLFLLSPVIAHPAQHNALMIEFSTGGDDLRGGNDNVNLIVLLRGGNRIRFNNVNQGMRWSGYSTHTVLRNLPVNLRVEDIGGVRLETTFGGGIGGDNWNLNRLVVWAFIGDQKRRLFDKGGNPLFRFTGNNRVSEFPFPAPPPPAPPMLNFQFSTGSDDLRGGNDNVNLIVLLRGGNQIRFDNVNLGVRWGNNSIHSVSRILPANLRFDDIFGVRIETTFHGGIGGDNWNLNGLVVRAWIGGQYRQLFQKSGNPLFRFTGVERVHEFLFKEGKEDIGGE